LEFDYYNRNSEKINRRVEPLQLWFKNKNWYLWGYCNVKSDYRLFKLNRIKNIKLTRENFTRLIPTNSDTLVYSIPESSVVKTTLKIHHSMAYRVYDEFDPEVIKEEEGYFYVDYSCPEDEWLYGYILSFGSSAEVLEPPHIREIIKNHMIEVLKKYT
jgi:predicted DNA-binding transcriptional regulator YafY